MNKELQAKEVQLRVMAERILELEKGKNEDADQQKQRADRLQLELHDAQVGLNTVVRELRELRTLVDGCREDVTRLVKMIGNIRHSESSKKSFIIELAKKHYEAAQKVLEKYDI